MKALKLIFILGIIFGSFSCAEKEIPIEILPTLSGGNIDVYSIAKVYAENIPVKDQNFTGTIGGLEVEIGRLPGDTLIFIVPNTGGREAELKVRMGNQIRTWDFSLSNWSPPYLTESFLEDFINSTRELSERIVEVDALNEISNSFNTWIEHFAQVQSSFSDREKLDVAGALHSRRNYLLVSNPGNSFELPCDNYPNRILSRMAYDLSSFDISYLKDYAQLPKSKFHDAVVLGLGLAFWYQKLLMEYYSLQILQCPVLQEIKLIDPDSGALIDLEKTISFQPKTPLNFGLRGSFKTIDKADIEEENPTLFSIADGFQQKEFFSKFFSKLIDLYISDYGFDLPHLEPNSIIIPSPDSISSEGDVKDFSWYLPEIDNPNVYIINYKNDTGKLILTLDVAGSSPESFKITLKIWPFSLSDGFVLSGFIEEACPLSVDVLLTGETHVVEIQFGRAPYTVEWSNAVVGELSQSLAPGNYEVKVMDAEQCERVIKFNVPEFGTVEDIDGNLYRTVKVGDTWWMAENLRTSRMRDGTTIQNLESDSDWTTTNGPAYSWLNNNSSYDATFGKLYNYYAACCDICPDGWRLPSLAEISIFSRIFGNYFGRYIRAADGWEKDPLGNNNLSGMNFLPNGSRVGKSGEFSPEQDFSTFWTSHRNWGWNYFVFIPFSSQSFTSTFSDNLRDGIGIRCVKEKN